MTFDLFFYLFRIFPPFCIFIIMLVKSQEEDKMNVLIKDTTREERTTIIQKSIALSTLDSPPPDKTAMSLYQKYIDGEIELSDIVDTLLSEYRNSE